MPWTLSPIPLTSDLEKGDLVQVTLEGGETRIGMVSDLSLESGTLTLTLWADPGPNADAIPDGGD